MNRSSNFISLAVLLFLCLSLVSCLGDKAAGPTLVSGELPELASGEIKTWINGQEIFTSIDAEGRFNMVLDLGYPQYPWFTGINKNLYLVPGDSLFIGTGDVNDPDSPLEFSGGESGLINTYYKAMNDQLAELIDTVDLVQYYGQAGDDFLAVNDRVISMFHESLDSMPGIIRG